MIGAGEARFPDKAKERLKAILGGTKIVVLASHSEAIVSAICNEVLWLEKGEAPAPSAAVGRW
jgi:homopolymeric O-antigen transport system ATP-binding protein